MKISSLVQALLLLATVANAGFLRRKGSAPGVVDVADANASDPIRKSKSDRRSYFHTTLDSGLKVLLVEDPEAQKSSYAMAVEVGSLEDPKGFQGLAHFCEHMVFLGSKKYPEEDKFSDRLAFFGGQSNAYTASDQTVYYAEVSDEGFQETFDIFAQFFIEPTFAANMVDKEINAVDSEHKKNMPDTTWRIFHLMKSRANPLSPVSQFSTGNLKTLKTDPEQDGRSLPEALKKFHKEHYCPSRMHLVIMQNSSIAQQLHAVHRSFDVFGNSAGNCKPRPTYDTVEMYSHKLGNLGRKFTVHTDGAPQLWLLFPTYSLRGKYKQQPEAYIHYAMNHYGQGGLKALLKREDLSMSYSTMAETSAAGTLLFVIFELTERGVRESDRVMEHFFGYFQILQKEGVNKNILEKIQSLNQVMFDYQDRTGSESGYVTSMAGSLPNAEPRDVLTAGTLIDEVDTELASKLLNSIKPGNMNVALVTSRRMQDVLAHQKHEQYYDFNFSDEALDEGLLQRLTSANSAGLREPPPLAYVPTSLDLIREPGPTHLPEKLPKKNVELWWLGLGPFQLPKAQVQLKIAYPRRIMKSPARSILAAMHSRLVQMVLEEPSDAFQMCGLSYSVSTGHDGLSLSFFGFNEHLLELVRLVLPQVRRPSVSQEDFDMVRRQMVVDLSDVTSQQPYQHAMEAFDVVTVSGTHSRKDLLKAAGDSWAVSLSEHDAMLEDMFANPVVTLLASGNLKRVEAESLADEVQDILGRKSAPHGFLAKMWSFFASIFSRSQATVTSDGIEPRPLVLNPGKDIEIRMGNPIPGDPNSATIVAYQFGVPSLADRLRFSLISSIIDRPVFQVLRTEHQLGYIVFGFTTVHLDILEVRVLVQGFREPPDVVERLIESAVANLTSAFASLTQEEFNMKKASLRTDLQKPPANLPEFAGRFWGQIWDETYCFDKVEKELHLLGSAAFQNPQSLLEVWKNTTQVTNTSRPKKLSVKLFGSDEKTGSVSIPEVRSRQDLQFVTDVEHPQMEDQPRWPHKFLCELVDACHVVRVKKTQTTCCVRW